MKRYLSLFIIAAFVISFSSCSKDTPYFTTDRTVLLTSTAWQIKHIRVVQTGQDFVYERGGQNNTFDYSNDFLKFETDGTGTYYAGNDEYDFTWQFDNNLKTELTFIIQNYADGHPEPGVNLSVKLENVVLSGTAFRYAELYTNRNGDHSAASVYREPAINFQK